MGQVVYLGLCLLGCLLLNPLVEGAKNCTVAEARSRCPDGAFYYYQFCYQYFDNPSPWYLAEVKCQALKTGPEVHLASITSQNEGRIVAAYLKSVGASAAWIGLQGTQSSGRMNWHWSDGSRFSLPLWDNRYPSTSSNECVSLYNIQNSNSEKWKQRSCSDTLPYFCKFKADY